RRYCALPPIHPFPTRRSSDLFEGFKALTDSVGGVVVESEQEFEIDGHTYTEGPNELSGEEALPFVRARKMFADGDLQRIRNILRSEEHTSELQSRFDLVCRLL